jgi:hypothetical protein
VIIQAATLLSFHKALVKRKYHLLFTPSKRNRPEQKEPSKVQIQAIVEMKQRNPWFGSPRIAQQINYAFDTTIDKDARKNSKNGHIWTPRICHIITSPVNGSDYPSSINTKYLKFESLVCLFESLKERVVISIPMKNCLPASTTVHHMTVGIFIFYSQRAWH